MLAFGRSESRDVESLQNWLDGTGCLAREETAYLTHRQELVSLAPAADNAVLQLEAWVEDKLIRFYNGFRNVREILNHYCRKANDKNQTHYHDFSIDPNVHIYSGPLVKRTAKALLLCLITLLLLIPVVICNLISTTSFRIIVVMASTISYLLVVSLLTKSRTMELILAGAT